jgi:hypothetical protein
MVSLGAPVGYQLSDQEVRLGINLILDPSGTVEHLTYAIRDGEVREFSGAEISSVVEPDSIRATVEFEAGTETTPKVTFEVIVPIVVVSPEPPDKGPFGITAVGLRITHFPTQDEAHAGPRQEFEVTVLSGRVLAR